MAELDEIIHQPIRLRIMAALVTLKKEGRTELDFTYLRDMLGVTDGNLGAHLRKLEEAGYITENKTFENRKPRTYVAVTPQGREVFARHVAALEAILKGK
jgi:DNA-binding MarR family transcriptional regulator